MRRKGGDALVTNERRVLATALALLEEGQLEFHGYQLVKAYRDDRQLNVAMSTLYRCLSRLVERKLLRATWKAPADEPDARPLRYYHLTSDGVAAAREQTVQLEIVGDTIRLIAD